MSAKDMTPSAEWRGVLGPIIHFDAAVDTMRGSAVKLTLYANDCENWTRVFYPTDQAVVLTFAHFWPSVVDVGPSTGKYWCKTSRN